ncbi:uncharacterized protein LOC124363014 [Homalodisca vitripennis]|uniref:uncharacterized protein LOC124363014 n=1 Tax=Homalodisca vitripennis TaxID=197043 RepID=UPI001EEB5FF6|nr:uncharacterized protein LOC124363014 [Homalodisca vitripennis]XP_046674028.1 uncharacterized protein LOC124363014 [Homalodisca vitripennis]XP_046674029.1 uncharacterized protein LOC124363014 [Homalodisca vitripennis]KAG8300282.1 hypothetical protein J6590_079629 [Homalodisca vitripennis]
MTGPLSENCCWCISLRGGTKIFGFISLVGSFLLAVLICTEIVAGLVNSSEEIKGVLLYFYADFVIQATHVVTSVVLLFGVYKEIPKLLLPWLVSTVVVAVSEVVFMSSFTSRLMLEVHDIFNQNTFFTFSTLALLDDIYGFIIVYSYYQTLPKLVRVTLR